MSGATSEGSQTSGDPTGEPTTGETSESETDETSGCGDDCGESHDLRGELMLFVNARLSSAEAVYQSNVPLDADGTFLGSALYLYDPLRNCDDGTSACRLARLGQLRLDDRLGPISVSDGSLQKFTLVDLAWSPDRGLWGVSFDAKNDEWGIASLDVDSWVHSDNQIGLDRYAIVPGDPLSPSTDPCYWQEAVSGLGFAGDDLLLGVRGVGGSGIPTNGMVFRVDLDLVADQGHCVYSNDVSADPNYYACGVMCQPWSQFEPQVGVAGDIAVAPGGDTLAIVRAENDEIQPLDRASLYRVLPPNGGPSAAEPEGLYAEPVPQGLDIEGLATIGGRLFGIDVWGKVYEFDLQGRVVGEHDDLSGQFDDFTQSLKIRGATTVVVP